MMLNHWWLWWWWPMIPDDCNQEQCDEWEDATKADADQCKTSCQDQPANLSIFSLIWWWGNISQEQPTKIKRIYEQYIIFCQIYSKIKLSWKIATTKQSFCSLVSPASPPWCPPHMKRSMKKVLFDHWEISIFFLTKVIWSLSVPYHYGHTINDGSYPVTGSPSPGEPSGDHCKGWDKTRPYNIVWNVGWISLQ